jgi:cation diffusion facilitator family transporter
MSFPKPVQLPEEVLSARKARSAAMVRIAIWGIGIRFGIAMFELAGFFAYKSSALLLDALSTFADVASSVLLIVSIKLAERPPDQDHPFGHGRYEPLVGLQLGIFLALGGMGLIVQQALGLMTAPSYSIHRFVLLIPLIAVICLECAYVMMRKVAKKENSPALEAEAFHFRIDSFNSLLALLALLF